MGSTVMNLPRIGDIRLTCVHCGWWGGLYEAIPDVDGDGSYGCPDCETVLDTSLETIERQTDQL